MRYKLLSCEIFYREMCAAVSRSTRQVDVEFLPKGLHDMGSARMLERLQKAVDGADGRRYSAVLLGYALCGNGLVGLTARDLPLVVARAHDCITLFLGSRDRYLRYFRENPGTYFKTTGWIERGEGLNQLFSDSNPGSPGLGYSYQQLVDKYGKDNADFLHAQLGNTIRHYSRMTFVEMGIEGEDRFELQTREEAERRGLLFEKISGDLSLIQRLLDGDWDDRDFLVVPPGCRIAPTYDDGVIGLEAGGS